MTKTSKKVLAIVAVSAAVLVLAAVVGLVILPAMNLRAEAEVEYFIPEIKDGKYYLNGDVQSGVYVLIDNGMVTLCGDDESIEKMAYEAAAYYSKSGIPSERGIQNVMEQMSYDIEPQSYHITPKIGSISKDSTEYDFLDWECDFYGLLNSYTEPDEDGFAGGSGFWYDGNDRLTRYIFEFIYVENA